MVRIIGIGGLLVVLGVSACASPLLEKDLKDGELKQLFEAYRQQRAEALLQRQQRLERGIRTLAVTRGATPEASRVSVDLAEAPLAVVVRRLLDESGIPYVFQDVTLRGPVTARFADLPLLSALNLLLESRELKAEFEKSLLVIRETPSPTPVAPPAPSPDDEGPRPSALQPTGSRVVPLEHLDPEAASRFLNGLYPAHSSTGTRLVQFGTQPHINAVSLLGPQDEVKRAARLLREMDRDPSHVMIEALVVGFDSEVLENLGTDLEKFAKGDISELATAIGSTTAPAVTFMYTRGAGKVLTYTAIINLLVGQGKARVIARPYVGTLSGRPATINISQDAYVIVQVPTEGAAVTTTQAVSAGVILTLTPTVMTDGRIQMDLAVEDSDFDPRTVANVAVRVNKRKAKTTMQVESRETITIGGLVLNRESRENAGLPWLRHVPLLNLAFAKQGLVSRTQEVAIFVTPHVWRLDMTPPLVAPEAFTTQEGHEQRLTPLERLGQ